MFHWAVVAQRENPLALLNYALVQQCLTRDLERAERFYHRALGALKPGDDVAPNVVENFELFEVERLPGGVFHSDQPSITVVRNSTLAEERPEWGEWGRYSHENALRPKAVFYFWLNPITKKSTWSEPDWAQAYRLRIGRSQLVGEKQGWEQYWDPRLNTNFFFNVMDGALTCEDPVGGGPPAIEADGDAPLLLHPGEAAPAAPSPHLLLEAH